MRLAGGGGGGGVVAQLHAFLTSVLLEVINRLHAPAAISPGKWPCVAIQ